MNRPINPYGTPQNFANGQQNAFTPQNFGGYAQQNLRPQQQQANFGNTNNNNFAMPANGFYNNNNCVRFNNPHQHNFNNQSPQNYHPVGQVGLNVRQNSPMAMNNMWPQAAKQNNFQGNNFQQVPSQNGRAVNNVWGQQQQQQQQQQQPQQFHLPNHGGPNFHNKNNSNQQNNNNRRGGHSHNWKNNTNNNSKKTKVKGDKRDLPENNAFYCDACDRGFKTQQIFIDHQNLHEKCTDCGYIAAPKLVKLHYNMQHKTGLAKKIWSMEDKEDVNKWINDRKKNFPTASNKARKEAMLQERKDRGEVLETKEFGKMKGRGGRERNFNKRKAETDISTEDQKKHKKVKKTKEESVNDHLDPMAILLKKEPGEISDEDEDKNIKTASNALTSLMACYGDSDSDDCEEKNDIVKPKSEAMENDDEDNNADNNNNKDGDGENNNNRNDKRRKRNRRKKQKRDNGVVDIKSKNKETLLEMLLAKEIRHERNIILQCVHYIVKKNFFNKE